REHSHNNAAVGSSTEMMRWVLALGGLALVAGAIVFIIALDQVGTNIGDAISLGGDDSGYTSVAWTRDGKHLLLGRYVDDKSRVYAIAADGSDEHELISLPDDGDSPAVSSAGRIAFIRIDYDTAGDVATENADGSGVRTLTHAADDEGDPAWSP